MSYAQQAIEILEDTPITEIASVVPNLKGIALETCSDDLQVLRFDDHSSARFDFRTGWSVQFEAMDFEEVDWQKFREELSNG